MESKLRIRVNKQLYKQAEKKARKLGVSLSDVLVAGLQKMVREKKITLSA